MIKQHQFEKPKDQEEDPCDYTNVEYWNFPSWTYTKEGIVFTPIFTARQDLVKTRFFFLLKH